MKKRFNAIAASIGTAAVGLATASILGGIIVLFKIWESLITWGVFLIVFGLSIILSMIWFGFKTVSNKHEDQRTTNKR